MNFLSQNGKIVGIWGIALGLGSVLWGLLLGNQGHGDCGTAFSRESSDASSIAGAVLDGFRCDRVLDPIISASWFLIVFGALLVLIGLIGFSTYKPTRSEHTADIPIKKIAEDKLETTKTPSPVSISPLESLTGYWKFTLGLVIASAAIIAWYFIDTLVFIINYSTWEQEATQELLELTTTLVLLGAAIVLIVKHRFKIVPWLLVGAAVVIDLAQRLISTIDTGNFYLPLVRYFQANAWQTTLDEAGASIALMQFFISGVAYPVILATVLAFIARRKGLVQRTITNDI